MRHVLTSSPALTSPLALTSARSRDTHNDGREATATTTTTSTRCSRRRTSRPTPATPRCCSRRRTSRGQLHLFTPPHRPRPAPAVPLAEPDGGGGVGGRGRQGGGRRRRGRGGGGGGGGVQRGDGARGGITRRSAALHAGDGGDVSYNKYRGGEVGTWRYGVINNYVATPCSAVARVVQGHLPPERPAARRCDYI